MDKKRVDPRLPQAPETDTSCHFFVWQGGTYKTTSVFLKGTVLAFRHVDDSLTTSFAIPVSTQLLSVRIPFVAYGRWNKTESLLFSGRLPIP